MSRTRLYLHVGDIYDTTVRLHIYMTPQLDYIVTSGVCEIQRGWGSLRPGAVNIEDRNHKTVTHNSM